MKRTADYPTSLVLASPARVKPPLALRPNLGLPVVAVARCPAELLRGAVGMEHGERKSRRPSEYRAAVEVEPTTAPKFARLEGDARRRAAVPTLVEALRLVRAGWCQGRQFSLDGRVSLHGAIKTAGATLLETQYAREVVARIVGPDLDVWNDDMLRVRADVVRVLRLALKRCGGLPHGGGWRVSRRAA